MTTYIQRIQNAIDEANIAEVEAIHHEAAEEASAADLAAWEAEEASWEAEREATRRSFVSWSDLTAEDQFQLALNASEQVLRSRSAENARFQWGEELPEAWELPEAVSEHLAHGYVVDDALDLIVGEAVFWVHAAYEDLEEEGVRPDFFNPAWRWAL